MKNKKRLLACVLTGACLLSMAICSATGAAVSKKYTVTVNGQFWTDVRPNGAPIKKVRNGTASRGRYGVNVSKFNGKKIVLRTRMHSSGHGEVGKCNVYSNTYNWAKNSGKSGNTYHLNVRRENRYDGTANVYGWWQADEN